MLKILRLELIFQKCFMTTIIFSVLLECIQVLLAQLPLVILFGFSLIAVDCVSEPVFRK